MHSISRFWEATIKHIFLCVGKEYFPLLLLTENMYLSIKVQFIKF